MKKNISMYSIIKLFTLKFFQNLFCIRGNFMKSGCFIKIAVLTFCMVFLIVRAKFC